MVSQDQDTDQKWSSFLNAIEELNDPLLSSIFKQTETVSFDATAMVLKAIFSQEFIFFNDWLENSVKTWKPLLQKVFGQSVNFQALFTGEKKSEIIASLPTSKPIGLRKQPTTSSPFIKKEPMRMQRMQAGAGIDVSDKNIWQKTALIMQFFPGIIQEYKEGLS